ncbi:MAG: hypothetical protein GY697_24355 [Desulfobacterales bacterium]|nr:hypothetical protein [Desulfobacterales bacterium]
MKSVCFYGMDGAGKTTQARLLADYLRAGGLAVCRVHLLTPGNTTASSLEKHTLYRRLQLKLQALPSAGRGAVVKLIIGLAAHGLDAWLTWWRYRRTSRNVQVLVYDRYYYDPLVLFITGFDRVPAWTAGLTALMPRPDLAIGMEVPPAVGHARKPEETLLKLERCLHLYRRITRHHHHRLLDGTRSITDLAVEIQRQWEAAAA